ncbi:MAG: hypothetical protein A3I12_06910 [Gammaproteobacteria bacterium RIFCSPLOWO2_02_FULL_38_11]|nr:MAG: hypothetical protein A2W47_02420 [Gammaproteobacteria bacterium RIFCSPHIGHO2_12_38_15]OGT67873.1 MAG: hypothetical protein A3I12_06910 [Gammaproteobacteria bacterium RIFCSPLOWO2_02_FULL_38_11]
MKIHWTRVANQNLKHIEKYLSQENPIAAIDTILSIIQTVELLKQQPVMGRAGRVLNTRELIISGTPYIAPYRIKNKIIEIIRVFHSSMKWVDDVEGEEACFKAVRIEHKIKK